jgi:hypothetical protein
MQARQPLAQLLQRLAAELCSASTTKSHAAEQVAARCAAIVTEGQLPRLRLAATDAACADVPSLLSAGTRPSAGRVTDQHLQALNRAQAAAMPQLPHFHHRHLHTSMQASTKQQQTAKAILVDGKPARKPRKSRKQSQAALDAGGTAESAAKPRRSRKQAATAASFQGEQRTTEAGAGEATTAASSTMRTAQSEPVQPPLQAALPAARSADSGNSAASLQHGPQPAHASPAVQPEQPEVRATWVRLA